MERKRCQDDLKRFMQTCGIIERGDTMACLPLASLQLDSLLDQSKPVIIGLSGGLDSMVLFDILKRQGYTLIAAHVNHQKRPEADQEEAFLKTYVSKQGMRIETLRHTFTSSGAFQAEARTVRNDYFKRLATQYATNQIALGHHEDDLIETFFMRLVKGSPLLNLIGMSSRHVVDKMIFVRPLLSVSKMSLHAYAQSENVPYFEDASNQSDDYTRNRFRQRLLPWLREENPAVGDAISLYNEALSNLRILTDTLATHYLDTEDDDAVSVETFASLNPLVAEAVLKKLIERKTVLPINLSKALLKRLLDTLKPNQNNLTIPIDHTWVVHLEYERFFVAKANQQTSWCLTVTGWGRYDTPTGQSYVFSDHKIAHMHGKYAEICYNCTVFPLYLRTRRPGDTMRCDYGHKKVSRLLIDGKVPPSKRDQMVLLADDQAVLWIPFLNKTSYCSHETPRQKIYIYEVDTC